MLTVMRALSKMSLYCVGDHHSLLQSLGSLVLMQLSLLVLELLQVSWLSLFSVLVIISIFAVFWHSLEIKSLGCFGELVLLPSLGGLGEVSWLFR